MKQIDLIHKFQLLTRWASDKAGSWQAFIAAVAVVITWIVSGFYFGFTSELYQLFINTLTTVWVFLMVFLIQSAQNRDTKAIHIKLDELLSSCTKANDQLIDIENSTDEHIAEERRKMSKNKEDNNDHPTTGSHP